MARLRAAWWDRFGTAEVGISDSRRTRWRSSRRCRWGRAGRPVAAHPPRQGARARCATACSGSGIGRCQAAAVGTYQGAGRWRLVLAQDGGEDGHAPEPRSGAGSVNVRPP